MDVQLPQELLQQIFSYLAGNQETLHACSLTSRSWYSASIAHLYENPVITGKNYDSFVRAICPSVNAHVRRNGLAELVRRLDMSGLVHNGSKSLTARLLGRVKMRLEEFVAPQASFAPFAMLKSVLQGKLPCSSIQMSQPLSPRSLLRFRVHINDRSLALDQAPIQAGKSTSTYVSKCAFLDRNLGVEAGLGNVEFCRLVSRLKNPSENGHADSESLTARSSAHDANRDFLKCRWPATLRELHISGGIHDKALVSLSTLPPSLSRLTVGNCPHLSILSIGNMLKTKGSQLHHLEIVAPIPALAQDHKPLSSIMELVPNLLYLKVSLDFLSDSFLLSKQDKGDQHPLRRLDLDCFDPANCDAFTPYDLWAAIACDSGFGRIRKVRLHRRLGWAILQERMGEVKDLDDLLKALAREDGASAEINEDDAGVVLFGKP